MEQQQQMQVSAADADRADDERVAAADLALAPSARAWITRPEPVTVSVRSRSKGDLERQVREICDLVITNAIPTMEQATPHYVAQEVGIRYPEYPRPTSGAVGAVFRRWKEIGAAVFDDKPWRFVGYTIEASEIGFTALYARKKS